MFYGSGPNLGAYCHWCGKPVHSNGRGLRTGKHLFCHNAGKCKMAHVRAYGKYVRRITPVEISPASLATSTSASGNAQGKPATRSSSGAISLGPGPGSNAKKRPIRDALMPVYMHEVRTGKGKR